MRPVEGADALRTPSDWEAAFKSIGTACKITIQRPLSGMGVANRVTIDDYFNMLGAMGGNASVKIQGNALTDEQVSSKAFLDMPCEGDLTVRQRVLMLS